MCAVPLDTRLPTAPPDFSATQFLLVDDFGGMRTMLRDSLRHCGVRHVDMAANGHEAILLLAKHRYDVVLCDYHLGGGRNGQQLLEEAKVRRLVGPGCAWVMVTVEKTLESVMGAAEYQPDGYLIKPITEAILQTRLAKIWRRKTAFKEIDAALAAHDRAEAIRLCRERQRHDKAHAAELMRIQCNLMVETGELDLARAAYERVLAERSVPWAMAGLAKIRYLQGDYGGAAALLQQVIDDFHVYMDAYDWLAQSLIQLGDEAQAEQVLTQAVRLSPLSVRRQKLLGDVAYRLGHLEQAEAAYSKSIALGEHSVFKGPDAYVGLAKTYGSQRRAEQAQKTLATLGKLFASEDSELRCGVVDALQSVQRDDTAAARLQAEQLLQRVTARPAAAQPATLTDLAELLLCIGERDSGVRVLLDLVRNRPDDLAVLDEVRRQLRQAGLADETRALLDAARGEAKHLVERGLALARSGQLQQALDCLHDAARSLPGNAQVLSHYAAVSISYMQQHGAHAGRLADTRAALQQAHALAPMGKRYAQLMACLDSLDTPMEQAPPGGEPEPDD